MKDNALLKYTYTFLVYTGSYEDNMVDNVIATDGWPAWKMTLATD